MSYRLSSLAASGNVFLIANSMRNLKIEELFAGAWVRQFTNHFEPLVVVGLHTQMELPVMLQGEKEYFASSLENVCPLQINEKLLRGFGFRKAKGDNVWLKQVADMRLTIGLRWKAGVQIARRCAISGKITCWNEEIRYLHELQRWWNDRVYFPFDIPLELKWRGVTEEIEEFK